MLMVRCLSVPETQLHELAFPPREALNFDQASVTSYMGAKMSAAGRLEALDAVALGEVVPGCVTLPKDSVASTGCSFGDAGMGCSA